MSRLSRNRKVQDLVHEVEIRSSTHYAVRKERERMTSFGRGRGCWFPLSGIRTIPSESTRTSISLQQLELGYFAHKGLQERTILSSLSLSFILQGNSTGSSITRTIQLDQESPSWSLPIGAGMILPVLIKRNEGGQDRWRPLRGIYPSANS